MVSKMWSLFVCDLHKQSVFSECDANANAKGQAKIYRYGISLQFVVRDLLEIINAITTQNMCLTVFCILFLFSC